MTKPGIYKHWRHGDLYRVLFNARVATNGSREGHLDVVYMDLKNGGIHTRDEKEWRERVWPESGDTVVNFEDLPEDSRHRDTVERFSFIGTMGNEMSDAEASELYDGLCETFAGREPTP